jgi:K+-transporting ATPase ATPase A chain
MSALINIMLPLVLVAALLKPTGRYIARVYEGRKPSWFERKIGFIEQFIYRLCGVSPQKEMGWKGYSIAILAFNTAGFALLYLIFVGQEFLPLNPQNMKGLAPDTAFNAAMSFVTNTNWQSYSGEAALSYLSQMLGCTVQNFLSAATGMAVAVALFRALVRKQSTTLGNAWVDITRGTLYILLPLACVFSIFLVSQGVVQNFAPYASYSPLEPIPASDSLPTIATGPAASQIAIKMLGSNGGGFFNANGAHPFENPTPLANILQIFSILILPASFAYAFGCMVGDRRQGWVLLAAMLTIFLPLAALGISQERHANPRFDARVIDVKQGNMEGKEIRVGAESSALWAAVTSATSNGSVNAMHDSFMPLGGLVPLLLIQFGEVTFGGIGSGMYGILMFTFITVFVGGLMVGRTPEYLGKKLGPFEIKMAALFSLIPSAVVLVGTAIAVATDTGRAGILNSGAHGFSEILYAFSSAANNNGSAFAGLSANTPFYNLALGICMFIGRFWIIVPVLAIAGSLANKNITPVSAGTLPTHTPLFMFMLVGVIILVGVLTYVPSLALGPIAEHLNLYKPAMGVMP